MYAKKKKMLEILDSQIQKCTECILHENGRAKPYWTENSRYMMVLEAPGKEEVENNEVIIGKTGRMLWDIMAEYQLTKEMFLIINSVNCRPMNGNKNGKPSEYHRKCCNPWLRKYIKVFKPKKIILFGNYAINTLLGEWGISKFYTGNILLTEEKIFDIKLNVIRSYHPSALIYDKKKEDDLRKSIKLLRG